jgi:hypothetical protein
MKNFGNYFNKEKLEKIFDAWIVARKGRIEEEEVDLEGQIRDESVIE